jgi:molybdenum cofactor guanylyltransferase
VLYNQDMLSVVIQAGGRSLRMGRDKALLPFLGQPLISRLVNRLGSLSDEILVVTNNPEDYAFLGLPLFCDRIPDRGALGGLYTALSAASQPHVAVIACDMPFANPHLLQFQSELLETVPADVVLPRTEDGYEPLHAVYRRATCLPAAEAALQAGQWKVISWFDQVRVRPVGPDELGIHDPHRLAFVNLNTPADVSRAERLAVSLSI